MAKSPSLWNIVRMSKATTIDVTGPSDMYFEMTNCRERDRISLTSYLFFLCINNAIKCVKFGEDFKDSWADCCLGYLGQIVNKKFQNAKKNLKDFIAVMELSSLNLNTLEREWEFNWSLNYYKEKICSPRNKNAIF